MNKIIITGNMVKNPEATVTLSGNTISKFTVAVNDYVNGERKTIYFDCAAFNKVADTINTYGSKGKKVLIDGKLSVYEGKRQDGSNYKAISVLVNTVEFLDNKDSSPSFNYSDAINEMNKDEAEEDNNNSIDVKGWNPSDDDLPF